MHLLGGPCRGRSSCPPGPAMPSSQGQVDLSPSKPHKADLVGNIPSQDGPSPSREGLLATLQGLGRARTGQCGLEKEGDGFGHSEPQCQGQGEQPCLLAPPRGRAPAVWPHVPVQLRRPQDSAPYLYSASTAVAPEFLCCLLEPVSPISEMGLLLPLQMTVSTQHGRA